MKYAGIIGLIISSTGLALGLCSNLVKQKNTCRQLVILSDIILQDLNYKMTPAPLILKNALNDSRLRGLNFINADNLVNKERIKSCLNDEQNEEISCFLYSFGKSDINTQINLVKKFKGYVQNAENEYKRTLTKNAKLYVALAFFGSSVLSIVII